ncbi:MAG: shikimate dehydrogenase [Sulfobacillus thermotolerans]|nr:shikimate dehydrogenase [Sulfobacillus thermotolerans]
MTVVMELYAVFGQPIHHSLSPQMHNRAFSATNRTAFYLPVECSPKELLPKLAAFHDLGGRGVNLTRPLKETIIPHLRAQSPWVEKTGAANTILWENDGWVGDNTDIQAFVAMVPPAPHAQSTALVLGQGGVARASVAGLEVLGYHVSVMARPSQKARWHASWIAWQWDTLHLPPYDVIVNATPLGQDGEGEWPDTVKFLPHTTIVDWVYRPNTTRLIQQARRVGAHTVDGLSLLVKQASLAWMSWFGTEGPFAVMAEAVRDYYD